jgi:uncharacterized protein (DUF1778 family)
VGVAGKARQCDVSIMKRRDDQITLRVPAPLRSELEAAASADDRSLSDIVRMALIDYATKRVLERGGAEVGAH